MLNAKKLSFGFISSVFVLLWASASCFAVIFRSLSLAALVPSRTIVSSLVITLAIYHTISRRIQTPLRALVFPRKPLQFLVLPVHPAVKNALICAVVIFSRLLILLFQHSTDLTCVINPSYYFRLTSTWSVPVLSIHTSQYETCKQPLRWICLPSPRSLPAKRLLVSHSLAISSTISQIYQLNRVLSNCVAARFVVHMGDTSHTHWMCQIIMHATV
jgi:hypothetical protein